MSSVVRFTCFSVFDDEKIGPAIRGKIVLGNVGHGSVPGNYIEKSYFDISFVFEIH